MSHAGNLTWRAMRGYIKPRFEFLETSNSLVCKSRQMQNLTSWYYHSIQCFSTENTTQRGWIIHQDHVCPRSKHGILQLTRACLMPIKSQLPNLKVHKCRTTRKHINAWAPMAQCKSGSKLCVRCASFCSTAKQQYQNGFMMQSPYRRAGGHAGAHRKRHHPIKICSLGYAGRPQISSKNIFY